LPSNWQQVYGRIGTSGSGALTPSAQSMRQSSEIYNCQNLSGLQQQLCQRDLNKPYQDKAYGQQAYQTALTQITEIQGLIGQISSTQDPKGVAELQARIAGESVQVSNEMNRLMLYNKLAEVEDRLVIEQQQEFDMKRATSSGRIVTTWKPVTFSN
jgi:type IV secretion system protein VirB5